MGRKLFNFVVLVSLVLLIAMCFFWVRSYSRAYCVGVSRSAWPSDDSCVNRYLSVRLVLGHWVMLWGRSDYDLTVPGITRFHHAMDVSKFRTEYAAGVRWSNFAYDVKLGPQPPTVYGQRKMVVNNTHESYFFRVPIHYGFGKKDDRPRTYLGRTDVEHFAVAPAWLTAAALAVLPIAWVLRYARRGRRIRIGHCPACGYDLRATPDRCPECGSVVTTARTTCTSLQ